MFGWFEYILKRQVIFRLASIAHLSRVLSCVISEMCGSNLVHDSFSYKAFFSVFQFEIFSVL